MMAADVLYRYDVTRWSRGCDEFDNPISGSRVEVSLNECPVLKRTPSGAWIDVYGARRFVRLAARKQYACETPAEAAESFRRRKTRQIEILKSQLAEAEQALRQLDRSDARRGTEAR